MPCWIRLHSEEPPLEYQLKLRFQVIIAAKGIMTASLPELEGLML